MLNRRYNRSDRLWTPKFAPPPSAQFEVNSSLSVTDQVAGIYLPTKGGPVNLLGTGGSPVASIAPGDITVSMNGPACYPAGGLGWKSSAPPSVQNNPSAITIFGFLWQSGGINAAGNPRALGLLYDPFNNVPWDSVCLTYTNSVNWNIAINGGGVNLPFFGNPPVGDVFTCAAVVDAVKGTAASYRNGGLTGQTTTATGSISASASAQMCFGPSADNAGTTGTATLIAAIWPRALSQTEIGLLSDEPFCLIRPVRRRIYYMPSAAAVLARPRITMFS